MPGIIIAMFVVLVPLLLSGVAVLLKCRRRVSCSLICLALFALYIQSIPATKTLVAQQLEYHQPLKIEDIANHQANVIVVLGGGRYANAPEYSGLDQINSESFHRLLYTARAAKQQRLPVLASGGSVYGEAISEAELISNALRDDFDVASEIIIEKESKNTFENAKFSSKIIKQREFNKGAVILVTHAIHMQRAVAAFEKFGITVVPAPVGFFSTPADGSTSGMSGMSGSYGIKMFIPNTSALFRNSLMLHEIIGAYWY